VLGKCYLKWKNLLDEIDKEGLNGMIILDEILKVSRNILPVLDPTVLSNIFIYFGHRYIKNFYLFKNFFISP